MEWTKILQKYKNVGEYEVEYKDNKITYCVAEYYVRDNRFLKYYILDMTLEENRERLLWKSIEEYKEFEELLVEEEFYSCRGDERYNIYIIFVVPESYQFYVDVQNDFQYARKIVLYCNEVNAFFDLQFPLVRGKEKLGVPVTEPLTKKDIKKILQTYFRKAFELIRIELDIYYFLGRDGGKKEKKSNEEMFKNLSEAFCLCFDFLYEDSKLKNTREKGIRYENVNLYENINKISKVKIKNYRRFEKECTIPFKQVNLLVGNNGVGKTSILEAIELGITGHNRGANSFAIKKAQVDIECVRENQKKVEITKETSKLKLAEKWYGIKVENGDAFNKLFTQYNYFDTCWASAFAIEGEEKVNIKQLQKFLGIEELELRIYYIQKIFRMLIEVAKANERLLDQRMPHTGKFIKKMKLSSTFSSLQTRNKEVIRISSEALESFTKDVEGIKWRDIVSEHIVKIESIFKLLVSSEEYVELKIENEEIVAVRRKNHEKVHMYQMSTGQKVCLALAFMFALFLSNDRAPRIIMLDEPVANLDDLHKLNLFDLLRRLELADTQIFFTTADIEAAKLFRRKFSYLEGDFGFYKIIDTNDDLQITAEQYSQKREEPVRVVEIYG